MADKIQFRRDTSSNWTSSNPVLAQGEFGYETDTGKGKVGNGTDNWNSLDYSFFFGGEIETLLVTDSFKSGVVNKGNSGSGTVTFNWNQSNFQKVTLTGNCTFAFSNSPSSTQAGSFMIFINQDDTGGRTITWPSIIRWAGGEEPELTGTANSVDIVTLAFDGANYYGVVSQDHKTA